MGPINIETPGIWVSIDVVAVVDETNHYHFLRAQSIEAVEYTDCISAEE